MACTHKAVALFPFSENPPRTQGQCDWALFDQGERLKAAGGNDDGPGLRRARVLSAMVVQDEGEAPSPS